jgi:hypothetical protein
MGQLANPLEHSPEYRLIPLERERAGVGVKAVGAGDLDAGSTRFAIGTNLLAALFTVVTVLSEAQPTQDLTTNAALNYTFRRVNVVRPAIYATGWYSFIILGTSATRHSIRCCDSLFCLHGFLVRWSLSPSVILY